LSKHGLSVVQAMQTDDAGNVTLLSILLHSSGEWIDSSLPVRPVKNDPQALGSAITYTRRFSLMALVGVAPSDNPKDDAKDDDGNAASGRGLPPPRPPIDLKDISQGKVLSPITTNGGGPVIAPKPIVSNGIASEIKLILTLQGNLGISDDELKHEIHQLFKTDSMKGLNLEQLKAVTQVLKDEASARLKAERAWIKDSQELL